MLSQLLIRATFSLNLTFFFPGRVHVVCGDVIPDHPGF